MDDAGLKSRVRAALEELVAEYGTAERGIEIRQVGAGTACRPSLSSTTWCAHLRRA